MKQPHDRQEIAQLLSRFMAGETSVAEEQLLAHYFRTHDVDEEWAEYKEMFALFDSGAVDVEVKTKPKLVALRWAVAAVAASALLLLVLRLSQHPAEEAPAVLYTAEKAPAVLCTATSSQSPSQPAVEAKEKTVAAEAQPTPQPAKRKTARKRRPKAPPSAPKAPPSAPKAPTSAPEGATIAHSHLTAHKTIEAPSGAVGGATPVSPDKQALADIYLAEVALQVAYQQQEQQQAVEAYAASLVGEEPSSATPIIAF